MVSLMELYNLPGPAIHYLDHAATSWPKPARVTEAISEFLAAAGANPGRGGHRMSLEASRRVLAARERIAQRFGAGNPDHVVFTANATESLNIAINGLLGPGSHAISSVMEHNSVLRPLFELQRERGVEISLARASGAGLIEPDEIRKLLRPNSRLIVITHASNVVGTINPVDEIAKIARETGVPLLVDAAQTSGILDIDISAQLIDLLAVSGHKGLEGPTGIGFLLFRKPLPLHPLKQGGTGSQSERLEQPTFLPDLLESGTLNTVGIAGLMGAMEDVTPEVAHESWERQKWLTELFLAGLRSVRDARLLGLPTAEGRLSVFSLDFPGQDLARIAQILDDEFGVLTRVGLHCAPLAHKALNSFPQGTIRISFGRTTDEDDVTAALDALARFSRE